MAQTLAVNVAHARVKPIHDRHKDVRDVGRPRTQQGVLRPHLGRRATGQLFIQLIGDAVQIVLQKRQVEHLLLDAAFHRYQYQEHDAVANLDQLHALDAAVDGFGRGGKGHIAHRVRQYRRRQLDPLIHLGPRLTELMTNEQAFLRRQGHIAQEMLDEKAVALFCRHTPSRGVWVCQKTQFLQRRHLITNGRRTDA